MRRFSVRVENAMKGPRVRPLLGLPILVVAHAGLLSAGEPLRLRATEAVATCFEAAARAYPLAAAGGVAVEVGDLRGSGTVDVLAGSAVEMTRALESGLGLDETDVAVARIPWVVVVSPGATAKVERLADLAPPGLEVDVLGGPAAYEARRALQAVKAQGVRESRDPSTLKQARIALVPLSLAGAGERVSVDVPPLVAHAAVAAHTGQRKAAEALVSFLASEPGQRAFAVCATPAQ
jgi:hypothetical protein